MKICIIAPSFPPTLGGAEVGAYELSKKLGKSNEVIVLTKYKKNTKSIEEKEGIKIMRIFPNTRYYTKSFFLLGFLYSFLYLRKIKPDICNIHYIIPYGLGSIIACKLLKIPTVLTIVGWDIYDPLVKPRKIYWPFIKYCLKTADHVVSVSNFVKRKTKEMWYNRKDIEVIPYGIDIIKFKPKKTGEIIEKYKLKNKKIILAVQRLHPRKRVSVLIKSFTLVNNKFKNSVLLIVGSGEDQKDLEELVTKLKIKNNVIFCGEINQTHISPYYSSADIFALHTLHEGLGVVILEAMASGLPIITTKAGGTEDLVKNNENGFLVEINNPEEMSKKILYLLNNFKARIRMSRKSRQVVEERYSWDVIANEYKRLFNSKVNK